MIAACVSRQSGALDWVAGSVGPPSLRFGRQGEQRCRQVRAHDQDLVGGRGRVMGLWGYGVRARGRARVRVRVT